jgi:hypothetical protein
VNDDDRLRLDYDQTSAGLRDLVDIRFKLLAFVPTIAGTAVAFFGHPRPAAELVALGALGLAATIGVLLYELRNVVLYEALLRRASSVEAELGFAGGGPVGGRPGPAGRLLGLPVSHRAGVGLVYGTAFAGWVYLVAWGIFEAADRADPQAWGAGIAAVAGLLVAVRLAR